MKRSVVVSFEGENIKVIYASFKREKVFVNDALSLNDGQFDSFLDKEKTKEFTVINNFKDFYQDVILVPPVKNRYLKKIIDSEIRKKVPFQDFSSLHTLLGERVVENRKMREVFFYAVRNSEINNIIGRFADRGKIVRSVYPDIFPLAAMAGAADRTVLCVSETGQDKNLFLAVNGRVWFARSVRSIGPGLNEDDLQILDMTLNYCRQTYRVNPSHIVTIGSVCGSYNLDMESTIPAACLVPPQTVSAANDVALRFISPISALFAKKEFDICPREHRNFYLARKFLQNSAAVLASLSVITAIYAGFLAKNVLEARSLLAQLRTSVPAVEAWTSYRAKKSEFEAYAPLLSVLRVEASAPDITRFFLSLAESETRNINLDSITLNIKGDVMISGVEGSVKARSYAGTLAFYQRFIDSIRKNGMTVRTDELVLKDNKFRMEVEYR